MDSTNYEKLFRERIGSYTRGEDNSNLEEDITEPTFFSKIHQISPISNKFQPPKRIKGEEDDLKDISPMSDAGNLPRYLPFTLVTSDDDSNDLHDDSQSLPEEDSYSRENPFGGDRENLDKFSSHEEDLDFGERNVTHTSALSIMDCYFDRLMHLIPSTDDKIGNNNCGGNECDNTKENNVNKDASESRDIFNNNNASKFELLKNAIDYIHHLQDILEIPPYPQDVTQIMNNPSSRGSPISQLNKSYSDASLENISSKWATISVNSSYCPGIINQFS
ncbi:unnamed protein product [Gordionus sp. m RMFG-2023]